MSFAVLTKKLSKSIALRGYWGTTAFVSGFALDQLLSLSPTSRREKAARKKSHDAFDREFDVDTAGTLSLASFTVSSKDWVFGTVYQPICPSYFRQVISQLELDYRKYTFVDFGCGKGRAILLASQFPFHRIIGVEWAQELVDVARCNLQTYKIASRACTDIELVCGDATSYALPAGPLLIYLYNPFESLLMERCVEHLLSQVRSSRREMLVVYVNPRCKHAWTAHREFEIITDVENLCVFRLRK